MKRNQCMNLIIWYTHHYILCVFMTKSSSVSLCIRDSYFFPLVFFSEAKRRKCTDSLLTRVTLIDVTQYSPLLITHRCVLLSCVNVRCNLSRHTIIQLPIKAWSQMRETSSSFPPELIRKMMEYVKIYNVLCRIPGNDKTGDIFWKLYGLEYVVRYTIILL